MKKIVALILGTALTALIGGTALAASAAPAESPATKPAATAGTPVAPPTTVAPAAAAPLAPSAVTEPAASPAAATTQPAADAKEQPFKIGYVNVSQLGLESNRGKEAAAALKEKSTKLRSKIEAKQKQLEKQKTAIQSKIATMSPKEREAKSKEFQKKVEEYQKLVRSSDLEMEEMQEKLTGDVFKAIKIAATAYGKSHGYAAVLDKKAVLYMADSLEPRDLTDEIAELLNGKPAAK
jgi:outer membrane protein